jgi:hypothetical protein
MVIINTFYIFVIKITILYFNIRGLRPMATSVRSDGLASRLFRRRGHLVHDLAAWTGYSPFGVSVPNRVCLPIERSGMLPTGSATPSCQAFQKEWLAWVLAAEASASRSGVLGDEMGPSRPSRLYSSRTTQPSPLEHQQSRTYEKHYSTPAEREVGSSAHTTTGTLAITNI